MKIDSELISFLENISKSSEPLSLSFSDFFPIEAIIDYRTITFNTDCTRIEYNDYCRENTKKIIININSTKSHSQKITQNMIKLIRSQFINENIEVLMGGFMAENETEPTVDIVLYR